MKYPKQPTTRSKREMKYKKGQVLTDGDYKITILKVFEEGFYVGKLKEGDVTLWTDEEFERNGYTLETPKAPPNDTLVEVRGSKHDKWIRRYSTGEFGSDGVLWCWMGGATSKTAEGDQAFWKLWRLCND